MRRGFWIWVVLVAILAMSTPPLVRAKAGSTTLFTSKDNIFWIPLSVSRHAAVTDYGLEKVYSFAQDKINAGKWVNAFSSELPMNPDTGKFESVPSTGKDFFIRYFGSKRAEICVFWEPYDDTVTFGSDPKKKIDEMLGRTDVSNGDFQQAGETLKATIGGLPAFGRKYKPVKGVKGNFYTIWFVEAKDIGRQFTIALSFPSVFSDPIGDFERVKKGIVFLRQ